MFYFITVNKYNMKISRKKFDIALETANSFKPRGEWSTGYRLDSISKAFAEALGTTKIKINVPYSSFNCSGTASKIAKDVRGLMPFTDARINFSDVTTLYYGDEHIKKSNYLPFQSDVDCFYVKNVTYTTDYIIINLIKGSSWRSFI